MQKTVLVLTYVTVSIKLCTTIFYKTHELFPYKNPESNFLPLLKDTFGQDLIQTKSKHIIIVSVSP